MILGTGEGRVQRASVKGTLLGLGERPWRLNVAAHHGSSQDSVMEVKACSSSALGRETGKIYGVDRVDCCRPDTWPAFLCTPELFLQGGMQPEEKMCFPICCTAGGARPTEQLN